MPGEHQSTQGQRVPRSSLLHSRKSSQRATPGMQHPAGITAPNGTRTAQQPQPDAAIQCRRSQPCSPVVPQHLLHAIARHLHKPAQRGQGMRAGSGVGFRQERHSGGGSGATLALPAALQASPLAGIDERAIR